MKMTLKYVNALILTALVASLVACDNKKVSTSGKAKVQAELDETKKALDELKKKAIEPAKVDKLQEIHRPWVDEIKIKCPKCSPNYWANHQQAYFQLVLYFHTNSDNNYPLITTSFYFTGPLSTYIHT